MTPEQITTGLLDLAKDRESFFRNDGDDDVFRHDYAVLMAAAELIKADSSICDGCSSRGNVGCHCARATWRRETEAPDAQT